MKYSITKIAAKSSEVYFHVQKNATLSKIQAIIPFGIEVLIVGFDTKKKFFFTALRGGIYE